MVIFDVDGTILDTAEGILSAVRYTIQELGLAELSEDVIKTFIGPPIQDSFAKAYQIEDTQRLQELARVFRDRYKDFDLLKASSYDGIYKVFERLLKAGIKPAIATYKREDYAHIILRHFGFDQYTNILYGADHENKLKKKDIIQKCLDTYGSLSVDKAIMIGDTDNDAIAAKQLGMDFLGVTYGFGFKTEEEIKQYTEIPAAHNTAMILSILHIG